MRKKFKTPEELLYKWKEYKDYCNNQDVLVHDFSSKNSEFVSAKLKKSVTYTIEGFCVFAGISRQAFYKDYADNRRYVDIVTRMREECEIDARMKFETGVIPYAAGRTMDEQIWATRQSRKLPTIRLKRPQLRTLRIGQTDA